MKYNMKTKKNDIQNNVSIQPTGPNDYGIEQYGTPSYSTGPSDWWSKQYSNPFFIPKWGDGVVFTNAEPVGSTHSIKREQLRELIRDAYERGVMYATNVMVGNITNNRSDGERGLSDEEIDALIDEYFRK